MSRLFNGTSDYMEHPVAVVGAVPITLACWGNFASLASARALLSIGDAAASTKVYIYVQSTTVTASTVDTAGTASEAQAAISLPLNTWVHLCAVFASASSRTIYRDGVLGASNAVARVLGTPTTTTIGARYTSGVRGGFMSGLIAEAAIWQVALSDSEVATLARGVSPQIVNPSNLKAYWPLLGRDSPELDRQSRFDLTTNGPEPNLSQHPVLQSPNWLSRTRRHPALDRTFAAPSVGQRFFLIPS